ncbi:hypothetical protein E1286_17300 [Nonomuraea terrae]|uniref:Uncharacterized protein n=1 Tax=Nonomuraea terrae TaxID=2530383 RepID=A0A4V2YLP8_9ACTN|nr:hypothetical protein [Nonomuraea terrae]TDD47537.1 hypothetical protein E1286_17300 [Nonomuraea terrae]
MVRLAFGMVTGRGQQVWDARGRLLTEEPDRSALPVVVGPVGADPAPAVTALARLVAGTPAVPGPYAELGVVAAGAGVELCPGFVSARLDGVRGDRRDAVLAALQVLGLDGLHRLGERTRVLVALFGTAATKPVAAAAAKAVADGRWAALHLASAAGGLLAAEQIERVLQWGSHTASADRQSAPAAGSATAQDADLREVVEAVPEAAASAVADHLERVLGGFPRRRRFELLRDLWRQVAARQAEERREERLRAVRGRQSRLDELRDRYRAHADDFVLGLVRAELGHEPTAAEAARWLPRPWHWTVIVGRAMHDALAATVLLRTAVAVAEDGVERGVARCAGQLAAATAFMTDAEAGSAARRVRGMAGFPARPGCYVRELAARAEPAEYVRQRLARAAEYAEVVMEAVTELLGDQRVLAFLGPWSEAGMRNWRSAVGYTAQRDPTGWAQPPAAGRRPPLSERLAARPGVPPQEVETVGDLLWYAELADALARFNGHDRAAVAYGPLTPDANPDPSPDDTRMPGSIPSALAAAAQFVSFGARPPRRCRTWAELTAGLVAGLPVPQVFPLPEPLAVRDGTVLPGTDVRVECARDARMLAEWAAYMGNCIGFPHYVEAAELGRCALLALRGAKGEIVANAELRLHGRAWHVTELRARFNADPPAELHERFTTWAATLPPPARERPHPEPVERDWPRPSPRRRANRTFLEISTPLADLAHQSMTAADTTTALAALSTLDATRTRPAETGNIGLTGTGPTGTVDATVGGADPGAVGTAVAWPGAGTGAAVVTALRRLSTEGMAHACRQGLSAVGPAALWAATGVRPLARALDALDPALRARHDHLDLLLADAPLPGSLRALARHEAIAPARTMELVARRVRATLGLLAHADDPVLAYRVARDADTAVLCALVIAVTSRADGPPTVAVAGPGKASVPGFPRSSLEDPDGPWRRAFPGAVELGADLDAFWERVAADGLRVPAAWLGRGGWPALWHRSASHRPAPSPTRTGRGDLVVRR